jgi:hypothetical protein
MLGFIERMRYRRMQRENQHAVLRAELAIGAIKRRTVCDLLDVSHLAEPGRPGDVIDATAIEVRPVDGCAVVTGSAPRTHGWS